GFDFANFRQSFDSWFRCKVKKYKFPIIMKLKILLALSMLIFSTIGFPQSTIHGRINDVDYNGIAFANVLLLNKADSLLIKGAVTDESGNFVITDIAAG